MIRLLALALFAFMAPAVGADSYEARPEVQSFIDNMVSRHGFVERELKTLFARTKRLDPVLEAIARPAERVLAWEDYRALLVGERRIAEGVEFWKRHRRTLERAERRFGVPAEIVVAIIGVETFYGKNTGNWRVVDALATLAFDYPPRASFFRSELESYLLFARDSGTDVFAVRGSYAGAMGIPQFMPSSARRYAVDFDGSGKIDLRRSYADAIGSVANFLKMHGWQKGADIAVEAKVSGDAWRPFAGAGHDPQYSAAELRAVGVEFDSPQPVEAKVALIELASGERPSAYRVGLKNFWVITRYNRSTFYAAAVTALSVELGKNRPQSAGK